MRRRVRKGRIAGLAFVCVFFLTAFSGETNFFLAVPDTAYAVPDPFDADVYQDTRIVMPLFWRDVRVEVYGENAALLVSLQGEELGQSDYFWNWDGRDDEGRVLPPGMYFVRVLYRVGEEESRYVFPLRLQRKFPVS